MGLDNMCYKLPTELYNKLYNDAITRYETNLKALNEYWSWVYQEAEGPYLQLSNDDFIKFTTYDEYLYDLVDAVNIMATSYGHEFLEPDYLLNILVEIYKYDEENNTNHEIDDYRKHYELARAFQKAGAIVIYPYDHSNDKPSGIDKLVCILTHELLEQVKNHFPDVVNYTFYKDFIDNKDDFVYLWVHSH